MARYAYIRVSTQHQSYERQEYKLKEYFNRERIDTTDIIYVSEKITSRTEFTERKIYPILAKGKSGDIVYVASLDRLGRTQLDILSLVRYAVDKGITLLTVDNGQRLENKTPMGKLYLSLVSAFAESERELITERVQEGVTAAREEIVRNGVRITRKGTMQTHWGNAKGTGETKRIMAIANEASCIAKQEAAILWREQSKAVMFAQRQRRAGWSIQQIADELGHLYDENISANPEDKNPYATPNGCKPSKGTVSKWCREMNPLTV